MNVSLSLEIDKKEVYLKMAKEEIVRFLKLPTLSKEYKEIASSMMINDVTHQLEYDDILSNSNIKSISDWENYIECLTILSESFCFAKKAIVRKINDTIYPETGEKIIDLNIKSLGSIASAMVLRDVFNKFNAYIDEYIRHGFIWRYDGQAYSFQFIE